MARVLITCPQMQRAFRLFEAQFASRNIQVDMPLVTQHLGADELIPMIAAYDGVIAGDDEFSAEVLAAAPQLRVISKWGVGVDAIDLSAAADLGITVTNTPGTFDSEVADVCLGYLIMLSRQLHRIDTAVRAGDWLKVEGISLHGRVLGILGLGDIGRAFASRGLVLGMNVIGADVSERACATALGMGVGVVSVDELVSQSDFLSLNCPLTPSTRRILNAESIARMRPGAFVINTARGQLIDETGLVRALIAGRLAGAALDVSETEPIPPESTLARCPNVILGSHNASNTREAVLRVSDQAVRNLMAVLDG